MKSLVTLVLLCLLAACATSPFIPTREMSPHPQPELREREAFIAALDQFAATNRLELLTTFQQEYPDSSLKPYADTIKRYARELDNRKAQLAELQVEQQELQVEQQELQQELEVAQRKNQRLKEENLQLEEKIDQLKKLLIELEQRSQ